MSFRKVSRDFKFFFFFFFFVRDFRLWKWKVLVLTKFILKKVDLCTWQDFPPRSALSFIWLRGALLHIKPLYKLLKYKHLFLLFLLNPTLYTCSARETSKLPEHLGKTLIARPTSLFVQKSYNVQARIQENIPYTYTERSAHSSKMHESRAEISIYIHTRSEEPSIAKGAICPYPEKSKPHSAAQKLRH